MRRVDAVIVGAGFAGMYMLHRLRGLGFSARVFEAGKGVGGTWYWNRYPGARCDVESMDYSYSFSPELEQEWEWTERYASQPEILKYANHVADRFDLKRDIQFETRVTSATFDEAACRWTVRTDRGDEVSAAFCVMATGCLSDLQVPPFPGLESFKGKRYHTGSWPHEGVDFTGRRVGIIGTGSSAIQSIPIIAKQAAHLYVFQRTPNYSVPAKNVPMDPEYQRRWKTEYPKHRQAARESRVGFVMERNDVSALSVSAEERTREFEKRWQRGGLGFAATYLDIQTEPGRQRHRRRLLPREDPRHRARPRAGRAAHAEDVPARHQATMCRYRLLRHLQPRQRHPGRRADRRPSRRSPPTACARRRATTSSTA